jgi:hypothetical protein
MVVVIWFEEEKEGKGNEAPIFQEKKMIFTPYLYGNFNALLFLASPLVFF